MYTWFGFERALYDYLDQSASDKISTAVGRITLPIPSVRRWVWSRCTSRTKWAYVWLIAVTYLGGVSAVCVAASLGGELSQLALVALWIGANAGAAACYWQHAMNAHAVLSLSAETRD
jgi:hypothetical protein